MILYKYVSFEAARKIVESEKIGFRHPDKFNDPFETLAAYSEPRGQLEALRFSGKTRILCNNYCVLSLTRSQYNPLMWAHYSEQHRGVVIGLHVDADAFTGTEENLIPVQYGSVIYTTKKPTEEFLRIPEEPFNISEQRRFIPEHLEKLQRAFLYKSSHWSYEEEVRIVRHKSTLPETISVGGEPLYLAPMPSGTLREVHFGIRRKAEEDEPFLTMCRNRNLELYTCRIDDNSWQIRGERI